MQPFIRYVTGPIQGTQLVPDHYAGLVVLSYLVASFAAYTALDFAMRVKDSGAHRTSGRAWLAGGACAMGTGIWAMHFIGMLAFRLPIAVRYDLVTTLLSLSVAVAISGFALALVTRPTLPLRRLLAGGAVMGVGVATMHYVGMAAMRMDAIILYQRGLFLLSVVNAIFCSTIALWMVFQLGAHSSLGRRFAYRALAALVMGVAISGMHYMAIHAGVCVAAQPVADTPVALDPELVTLVVAGVALLIVGVVLAITIQSHHVGARLKLQNETLRAEIAERRRAEEALIGARDAARFANRAKSQFLANMSHEIRTPMSAVIGMTTLLRGTRLDDKQRRFVDTTLRSADALLKIIDDIFDFSNIEAGKVELRQLDFSPRAIVAAVDNTLRPLAEAKGLDLDVRVGETVPALVNGDAARLRQVLENLVDNAIKFTSTGSVTLRAGLDSDHVLRFAIADTGIGISAAQLPRIFDAFAQGDGSSTRRFGGTGLGLAIAKHVVELNGGTLDAHSIPGQGSTFCFSFPFHPVHTKAAGAADGMAPLAAAVR